MKIRVVRVITIPYLLSIIIIKLEYKLGKSFFRIESLNGTTYLWGGLYGFIVKTHTGKLSDD